MPSGGATKSRFVPDPWRLIQTSEADGASPVPRADDVAATLFAVSNGYLGIRGDGGGTRALGRGTFVNGFHETFPIRHAETAYGLAWCGQVIQGVPDLAGFTVRCNGIPLVEGEAHCVEARQELDLRAGVATVEELWQLPQSGRIRVRRRRMASLAHAHLAVFRCEVSAVDTPCEIEIGRILVDSVDTRRRQGGDPRQAELAEGGGLVCGEVWRGGGREVRSYCCQTSREPVTVGVVSLVRIPGGSLYETCEATCAGSPLVGETLEMVSLAAYHTLDAAPIGIPDGNLVTSAGRQSAAQLRYECEASLEVALREGPEGLLAAQRSWLDDFWAASDVRVSAGAETVHIQQAVRWSLLQLAQASAQARGHGVPAKGLTGSGYSGHYFWDTEIYLLPFLSYTRPESAKALLEFRHAMLPAARRRARDLDLDGALFPWRTINGEEAGAYYPAGTAQFHIDADIAFAACQYVAVSGDREFLAGPGVDLLVETARMWLSLGFWQTDSDAQFHLHGVTGPDEYTAVVDDNLYTNVMARFNLAQAAEVLTELAESDPDTHARIVARLGISEAEPRLWRDASEGMFLPWDAERGIHPQDAHFLTRKRWDVAATPPDRRPLLLHYHSLVIYRHQVLKQADVVLALLLRGIEFTAAARRADFDYYEPLTTGDSTLSGVSQAVIAAEVGHAALALRHFHEALRLDLDDRHHNTADGVHLAAAGGIWSLLVCGFGGLRDYGESPRLDPRLPAEWDSLEFSLTIRGAAVGVRVTPDAVTLRTDAHGPVRLMVMDKEFELAAGKSVHVPLQAYGDPATGD